MKIHANTTATRPGGTRVSRDVTLDIDPTRTEPDFIPAAGESWLSAKDGWRGGGSDRIPYLRHLESLGYALSDVERVAADYETKENNDA